MGKARCKPRPKASDCLVTERVPSLQRFGGRRLASSHGSARQNPSPDIQSRKEVKAWLTTPSPTIHRPTIMGGDDTAGFPRDGHRDCCLRRGKLLQIRLFLRASPTDLRPTPPVILLRGLPARSGSLRRFHADSGAGSVRDEKKLAVDMSNTYADLQEFYGSDGTRTRDLRRDRPVMTLPA